MPGPPPKPDERRARRNTPVKPTGRQMPSPPPPEMRPPPKRGWLKATKDDWTRYWATPLAGLVVIETDAPSLEELFDLYDERRRYRKAGRSARLVKGSTGQMVVNPLLREARAMGESIAKLEERFGLGGPKARIELGLVFGEASRTLDDWNAELASDDDDDARTVADERADPDLRLTVIEGSARAVG